MVSMIIPRSARQHCRRQSTGRPPRKIWQGQGAGRQGLRNGQLSSGFLSIHHRRNNRINSQKLMTRMVMETTMTSCHRQTMSIRDLETRSSIRIIRPYNVKPQTGKFHRQPSRPAVDSIVTANRCYFSYHCIRWPLIQQVICRVRILTPKISRQREWKVEISSHRRQP